MRQFIRGHRSKINVIISIALTVLVIALVMRLLKGVSLEDVANAVTSIPIGAALLCCALALASYLILICYDLMAIHYLKQSLPWPIVALSSFVAYAFNFNLGSIVGGIGMRLRLYRNWGLPYVAIAKLVTFCAFTAWSGYSAVTGWLLVAKPEAFSTLLFIRPLLLVVLGAALLLFLATFFLYTSPKRRYARKGVSFTLPSKRLYALQLLTSSCQWVLPASILYFLLRVFAEVSWSNVLAAYVLAAVAALIIHIPAGLGVIEGTFILAFGDTMSRHDILAAILAFRGIYHILPFALALLLFGVFELSKGKLRRVALGDEKS